MSKVKYKTKNAKGDSLILLIPVYIFTALNLLAFSHLNFPLYLTEAANVSNGAVVGAWVVVVVKQESHRLGFFHGSPALASALSHSTFPYSDKQGEDVPAVDLSIDSTEI